MGAKEYEMPNGRKVVFEFDKNGVGNITLEAMDLLMGMINIDLVRCGECARRKKNGFCLEHNRYERNDDGFCNYGERRE